MNGNSFCWRTKVLFGDIDYYGVVFYLRYFDWCTQAREHFILSHLPDALNRSCSSVIEVIHKFHRPARLNDDIIIEVSSQDVKRASVRMIFRIYRVVEGARDLIGEQRQKILFLDGEGKLTRMLPEICSMLKHYEEVANSSLEGRYNITNMQVATGKP